VETNYSHDKQWPTIAAPSKRPNEAGRYLVLTRFGARVMAGAIVCLSLLCCSPAPTQVVVQNTVVVAITNGPSAGKVPPTIDLSDKRIDVALNAIAKHIGGQVQFEIDNTLIPKFGQRLHDAFVEALETIVTSLDYVAKYHPEYSEFAGPHLRTVRWIYKPSRRQEVDVELDVERNSLEITVAADAHRLVEDSLIATVFGRAWDTEKVRRYADASPARIPPSEHKYYLEYLRAYRGAPGANKVEREEAELRSLGRLLQFYPFLKDGKLKKETIAALVYGGRKLQSWYGDLGDMPELEPTLNQVHAQWIGWLNKEHTRLTDVQLGDMGTHLFTFHYEPTPGYGEGLDILSFATPRIRSWIERNKVQRNSYGSIDRANDSVVCPAAFDGRTHSFSSPSRSCNGRLYTTLAKSEPNYRALIGLLTREDWLPLTQTATLNVLDTMGTEAVVEFWDVLAANIQHARAALVALAQYNGWGPRAQRRDHLPRLSPKPFVAKIPQWWHQYPAMRPQLLYLLTTLGNEYEGSVRWPKLSQYLGTRLSQNEVAAFLQQSPDTIWHLRNLVHAVGDGWSRSQMVIPELERFLNEANETGRGEPSPYYVTERCVEFLCRAGTAQDLAALKTFLRERGENYPSERRYFDSFISQSNARVCPAAPAKEVDTAGPAVFFGD
jgi:hypothetical protein